MKRAIEKKNGCSCSWSARVDRFDRPAHIFAFGKKDLITGCVCVNRLIDMPPHTLADRNSSFPKRRCRHEKCRRRRRRRTRGCPSTTVLVDAPYRTRRRALERVGRDRTGDCRAGFGKRPGRRRRRRRGTLSVAVCCALDSFIGCRSFVST